MESFAFELKLVSDVDRVAKRGSDGLKQLGATGKKTAQELDFTKPLARVEAMLHRIDKDPAGFVKMKKAQKELAEQQRKLLSGAGLKGKTFGEVLGEKFSLAKLAGGVALGGFLAEGAIKAGEILLEAAHKFVEIITDGMSDAFKAAGAEEKSRLAFRLSLGGREGKETKEDVERFAKLTKFTPEQIEPMLLRLRRAGFDQKAARQVFATGADIEAGGGMSTQDFADFAEHLKLKGGVTTKQLVHAGINAPEFYKDLGKKLGISASAAEKRAGEGGKIDSQLMLNQITLAVNKRQGGAAGTGAMAESQGLLAKWEKFKNLPEQYFKKLVDSPGYAAVSNALGELLSKLDPETPEGERIMGALNRMFERITSIITNISTDDIVTGIDTAVTALEKAVDLAASLASGLEKVASISMQLAHPIDSITDALAGGKGAAENSQDKQVNDALDALRSGKISIAQLNAQSANMTPSQRDDIKRALHISDQMPQQSGGASRMAKVIQINVHPGAVAVHAAPGDSPDKSHREAGANLHKHVVRELERAAQEGGG